MNKVAIKDTSSILVKHVKKLDGSKEVNIRLRQINPKFEKWKYYHVFTPDQVFRNVYCCIIDRTLWINGKDGFFYRFLKETKVDSNFMITKSEKINRYEIRNLEFVTDNMRTGYNFEGDPICHRRNYFGRHRNPLRAARIIPKRSKNYDKSTL